MLSMPRPRAFIVALGSFFILFITFHSFRYSGNYGSQLGTTSDITRQKPRTSRVHLMTTATTNDVNLCRLVASAAINSYPPPLILAWHGEGEFNAAESHMAKIPAALRYFDSLPPDSENDLVLFVDGFDVVFQLGPDVLLKRYHDTVRAHNKRVEAKFGVDHVRKHNMYTTLLYGPDVLCYPVDFRRPACWLVPESTLAPDLFGPKTDRNDQHARPRWLNSGTVLGPIKDLRILFEGVMDLMNRTYDPNFYGRNSDQFYIANLWADQEFVRMTSNGDNTSLPVPLPDPAPADTIDHLEVPAPADREKAEKHIGIDYEGYLYMTMALFHDTTIWKIFNTPHRFKNPNKDGDFEIPLAPDVIHSKLPYRSLPRWTWANRALRSKTWSDVPIAVNSITRNFMPVIHFTGVKKFRDMWWEKLWFIPHMEMLLETEPDRGVIAKVDGIRYEPYLPFGKKSKRADSWADTGELLGWEELCGEHVVALKTKYVEPPKEKPKEEKEKPKEDKEKPKEQQEKPKEQHEDKPKEQHEDKPKEEKPKEQNNEQPSGNRPEGSHQHHEENKKADSKQ